MNLITPLANATMWLILLGSVAGWIHVVRRLSARQPLVEWEARRPAPWGLAQLIALLFLMILLQVVTQSWLVAEQPEAVNADDLDASTMQSLLNASSMAYIAWLLIAWWYLTYWHGASPEETGYRRQSLLKDVWLGVVTFVVLAPVVYGIQYVLVQRWPSRHPLVEALRASDDSNLLAAAAISAVVMAPLFEEFAFRLLVQGWFENAAAAMLGYRRGWWQGEPAEEADAPPPSRATDDVGEQRSPRSPAVSADVGSALLFGWFRPREPKGLREISPRELDRTDDHALQAAVGALPAAGWSWRSAPVLASSLIFALLHFNHGPDWVPLFVLALGLGYLYQRTHRIVPCIVVHALLNGVSFLLLLAELATKD